MTRGLRCLFRIAHIAILCVMLISISDATADQVDDSKPLLEGLDKYITAEVLGHSFRGTVLVGVNGQIVFKKAYGLADEQWNTPNTTTTKFRIASLSKQFTAACILLLQER